MLPPYELENKKFTKAIKGYSSAEVDEHLVFVTEKYTELYNAYNELERRLKKSEAELAVYKKKEEESSATLARAREQAQKIIEEAEARADDIREASKEETDKILIEFKKQIKIEKDALRILQARIAEFRDNIYSQYHQHIELLESIVPEIEHQEEDDWSLPDNEYVTMAVHQIQLDVADKHSDTAHTSREREHISDELLERLVSERDSFGTLGQAALGYDFENEPLIDVRRMKKDG
ncbi:MAG: hypothetical protein E7626_02650 [Ruminococcaceae bacterium]|nr:hypothetical protein [Oscillospiraceae bacterium]